MYRKFTYAKCQPSQIDSDVNLVSLELFLRRKRPRNELRCQEALHLIRWALIRWAPGKRCTLRMGLG